MRNADEDDDDDGMKMATKARKGLCTKQQQQQHNRVGIIFMIVIVYTSMCYAAALYECAYRYVLCSGRNSPSSLALYGSLFSIPFYLSRSCHGWCVIGPEVKFLCIYVKLGGNAIQNKNTEKGNKKSEKKSSIAPSYR